MESASGYSGARPTDEPRPAGASKALESLSPEGVPRSLEISPDGQYAVYSDIDFRLFSLRIRDGLRTEIAPPPSCSNMFEAFEISPDSRMVLFKCPAQSGSPVEIWVVPIEGPATAATRVSLPADPPFEPSTFPGSITNDRVFYQLARLDPFHVDLYSVPIEGPASAGVVLNAPLAPGAQVANERHLPLTSRVLYQEWLAPEVSDLWITEVDQSKPVRIVESPPSHPHTGSYLVSSDEQRIVWYAADEFDDSWLYSAPIADPPGAPTQLNADMPFFGTVSGAAISPNSQRVAFLANQENLDRVDLFSVPIDGPAAAAVNLSVGSQPWIPSISYLSFTEDSGTIYYVTNREMQNRWDLVRVPQAGPAAATVRINPADDATRFIDNPTLIPGTNEVLFERVNSDWEASTRCYRGDLLGAEANAVPLWTQLLPRLGIWFNCRWLPESGGVLFASEDSSVSSRTLWLAHGDGPADLRPLKILDSSEFEVLHDPLRLYSLEPTPDGKFIVFRGTYVGGEPGVWTRPLPFFWDGFESAGTAHWSSMQP